MDQETHVPSGVSSAQAIAGGRPGSVQFGKGDRRVESKQYAVTGTGDLDPVRS